MLKININPRLIKVILAAFLVFLANLFITRYIGQNFGSNGLLNYSSYLNISTLILIISCLGSESGLVRESFNKDQPLASRKLMYYQIMIIGFLLGVIVLGILYFTNNTFLFSTYNYLFLFVIVAYFYQTVRVTFLQKEEGYRAMLLQALTVSLFCLLIIIRSSDGSFKSFITLGVSSYFIVYSMSYIYIFLSKEYKNTYLIEFKSFTLDKLFLPNKKLYYIARFSIVTTMSMMLYNSSELFMRMISIKYELDFLYANIEAYTRVSNWWYGMGIAVLGNFYFPRFSRENSENIIFSNSKILKDFFIPLLLLTIIGIVFGTIIFLYVYNNVFDLNIYTLMIFSLGIFVKLFGVIFSMLSLTENRLKTAFIGELLLYLISPAILAFILFNDYQLSIIKFAYIYLISNVIFFLFLAFSRFYKIKPNYE